MKLKGNRRGEQSALAGGLIGYNTFFCFGRSESSEARDGDGIKVSAGFAENDAETLYKRCHFRRFAVESLG